MATRRREQAGRSKGPVARIKPGGSTTIVARRAARRRFCRPQSMSKISVAMRIKCNLRPNLRFNLMGINNRKEQNASCARKLNRRKLQRTDASHPSFYTRQRVPGTCLAQFSFGQHAVTSEDTCNYATKVLPEHCAGGRPHSLEVFILTQPPHLRG